MLRRGRTDRPCAIVNAVTPPTASGATVPGSRIATFVHHRARLTEGQQRAWDRSWPTHGRDVDDLLAGTVAYDPPAWFGRRAPLVLEIGSGMGESTAALAAAVPDHDHLAVEVFEPGLAQLLMRIEDAGLTNLAVLRGDAVELLRACVPPGSLTEVRILFPDPWPKRRHRKRRLVQPDVVGLLASRLVPGGVLHLATDWDDYAAQMRNVCDAEPRLDGGPTPRPVWRPVTKFEERAHIEGRDVHDLRYLRRTG